jgi:hypothetical protein
MVIGKVTILRQTVALSALVMVYVPGVEVAIFISPVLVFTKTIPAGEAE